MALYTEKLTATIKYWYEETDRPIESIANDFDVCARNIQRMAVTGNWNRRKDRKRKPRNVLAANLLLAEAMGLEAQPTKTKAKEELGPRLRGDDRENLSAIDRLEALVLKEIEAEEQGRAARPGRRSAADAADRRARTLSTLTQTLHTLQRLRAGDSPDHGPIACECTPEDMDAFREDLARRINAFMASRPDLDETCEQTRGEASAAD
jgi:hypothetical protein